jgi:Vacuolar protein sorting-associated protein 26
MCLCLCLCVWGLSRLVATTGVVSNDLLTARYTVFSSQTKASCSRIVSVSPLEIMDGCPFAKDVIPVRLQLAGIPADLTPTYTAVNNRFSVKYYLNLVLVDEEDRRYFKQQEIILWRQVVG